MNALVDIENSTKWTDLGLWISFLIVGLAVLAEGVREARRLFRRKGVVLRNPAGSMFLLI